MMKAAPLSVATVIALLGVVVGGCRSSIEGSGAAADGWRADPAIIAALAATRPEVNATEARVPRFELPDPLRRQDGTVVHTPEQWPARRAELLELFREHVYGQRPDTPVRIDFVPGSPEPMFDGRVMATTVVCRVVRIDRPAAAPFEFSFAVYAPHPMPSALAPAIIHINNRRLASPAAVRDEPREFSPIEAICGKGYVFATLHTRHVDPDRSDGYADGLRGFLAQPGERANDDWGALSAWGWGASRVLDFLVEQPWFDEERVAVVGHSRGGKAALWAAAEDTRFRSVYSNNSGCGGAALSRRRFGETVSIITSAFPHWFAPNFAAYSHREGELPVDQHQLMALIAPRRLYVASAGDDLWADPRGEYLALAHAALVYEVLGFRAVNELKMPPPNIPIVQGRTGYHLRPGEHDLKRSDWLRFLGFMAAVGTREHATHQ
ncbi:MAG: prolyl oligopeptidase family serine peptidase [Planctomycetota bacterium]